MSLGSRIRRELLFYRGLARTLGRVRSIASDSAKLLCDDLEASFRANAARRALTFEGRSLSYGELDALANRYAHWALACGFARGQVVAVFLPNRAEYFPIWYGLSKVGVVAALINNQLQGASLAHCLGISGARACIVDPETAGAFAGVAADLDNPLEAWTLDGPARGLRDLQAALEDLPGEAPDRSLREGMRAADSALLIFTSGTTGLPKAARINHVRAQLYMRGFAGATGARASDRIYVALPLYHATGGLCALGAAFLNGGSVVLKRRFSASAFWPDVITEDCTMFVYIGELCRYLVNQPPQEGERSHRLRLAFGNGLGAGVWRRMDDRFAIPRILEFYGSTEGNVSMFNFDGHEGAIGRAPAWLRARLNVRLIRFDVEKGEPARDANGLCIECAPGEVGECVGMIGSDARSQFTGYLDRAASERKIARDVMAPGDAWFRTGDLLRQDAEGYFYFVDRIGDTFRWKGENVSTTEVATQIARATGVLEANVYGVRLEGAEGRAGMAALVTSEAFDLTAFASHVDATLPAYARPVFLRLMPQIETTGTFKQRKVDLIEEGFDPHRVRTPLYYRAPETGGYVPVTAEAFEALHAGRMRL